MIILQPTIKSNQFISSHTTDIHNLQNQSNENIHIMCDGEYPRSSAPLIWAPHVLESILNINITT